eukprot:9222893-Pyramimonas_sp.AAC.1
MDVRVQWMEAVLDVEPQARGKHDLRFYSGVGRLLADVVCSAQPEDYADDYVRDVIRLISKLATRHSMKRATLRVGRLSR